MNLREIPYEFVKQTVPLGLRDAIYGVDEGLLKLTSLLDVAKDLEQSDIFNDIDRRIPREIYETARSKSLAESDSHEVQRKWLYIVLSWLYAHRDDLVDPLADLEIVFAEFAYPASMYPFVPFMPIEEGDCSPDAPQAGPELIEHNWRRYLSAEKDHFAKVSIARQQS